MFAQVGKTSSVTVKRLNGGHAIVEFDSDEKGFLPYTYLKTQDVQEGDRITVLVTSKEPGRSGGVNIQVEEV